MAKNSAVMAAAGKLGGSLADLLAREDAETVMVDLDDIEILAQDREVFEDDENSLADLGKSLRKRQIQPIVLRRTPKGRKHGKAFELVAGERRVRAARVEGLDQLLALVFDLTDEEAADLQLAENIHRMNLSQLEEAKRLKRDVDTLGSVEAVLAKHNKSKSWLSKRLALLDLPPQAKRLITENVTADKEVINLVRTIEKVDPKKAKKTVDALKERGPRGDARAIAAAAKEEAKPSTRAKTPAPARDDDADTSVATAPDARHREPGSASVTVFPKAPLPRNERVLEGAWQSVVGQAKDPSVVVASMGAADRSVAEAFLRPFYQQGKSTSSLSSSLFARLRAGDFGPEGVKALALLAYVRGFEERGELNLAAVLQSAAEVCSPAAS
jgi:ParB family chromosome partitioning protein